MHKMAQKKLKKEKGKKKMYIKIYLYNTQ